MIVSDEQRASVVILCQEVSATASLIVKHCDTLLEEGDGLLNTEQMADIGYIHQACQELISIADKANQAIGESSHLQMEQEAFSDLVMCLHHDLRSPVGPIVGFAQLSQKEITGPLNEQQKETVNHIHALGLELISILNAQLKAKTTQTPIQETGPATNSA